MLNNIFRNERIHKQNERIRINKLNAKINAFNRKPRMFNAGNFSEPVQEPIQQKKTKKEIKADDYIKDHNPYMDNVLKEEVCELNLNENIKTIYNVIKLNYDNDVKATGLGDYIRGCYFLLQYCEENKLNYGFDIIDNNMAMFLDKFKDANHNSYIVNKLDKNNGIHIIDNNNYISYENDNDIENKNELIEFFNSNIPNDKGCIFVNINCYPNKNIDQNHIIIMRDLLTPTEEIYNEVNHLLTNLSLTKYNFKVMHIRLGDDYIINNKSTIDIDKLMFVMREFNILKLDKMDDILLITDCNILKQYIFYNYPELNVKFIINDIRHTADLTHTSLDTIKNTLIDFYLMSYSTQITSLSVYGHGSGFSEWCATTYNIPYSCKLIG